MKYCSKCGNELLDEAVICPNCGLAAEKAPLTEKQVQENKDATSKTIRLILAIGIVLGTIFIAMGQYNNWF